MLILPLEALAAIDLDRPEDAAKILGASESLSSRFGIRPPSGLANVLMAFDATGEAREALGPAAFEAAKQRGREMTQPEILDLLVGMAQTPASRPGAEEPADCTRRHVGDRAVAPPPISSSSASRPRAATTSSRCPGEETMDVLDALAAADAVRHVTTRHEQGAAFMADVHGRLTGRARWPWRPSARAPRTSSPASPTRSSTARRWSRSPARSARTSCTRKPTSSSTSCSMFAPVTKWNTRVERIDAIPEIVRKAFRVAALEKPGPTHIELPENLAAMRPNPAPGPDRWCPAGPTSRSRPTRPSRTPPTVAGVASGRSSWPATACSARRLGELRAFARGLHVPVAVTFMGKGAIDDRSHLSLMAVGLQARDHVMTGFDRADLVVSRRLRPGRVRAHRWNPAGTKRIVHIDTQPAEVDAAYRPEVELIGDIDGTSSGCSRRSCRWASAGAMRPPRHEAKEILVNADLRPALLPTSRRYEADDGFPIQPQKAIADLRAGLEPDDIVVSDVGAHKVWVARLYQAYEPNTVIICNGFAAMGISLPGAIAAKLVHPERRWSRCAATAAS